jgi:glycosyltransferase involved in cell wall biosynthesis
MRLLIAYRVCGLGGVETSTIVRARALADQGHDVTVSFPRFYGEGGHTLAGWPGVVIQDDAEVVASIRAGDFDAVVVIDHPALVDAIAAAHAGVPLIFETHAAYLPSARRYYESIGIADVRGVIVPSEFNRNQVLAVTNTTKPVLIAPNPVDESRFAACSLDAVRQGWPELAKRRVIIWIGRLEDEKNPYEFLEIADNVAARQRDVSFLMVGDSPHDPAYGEALRAALAPSLEERLHFRKFVPYEGMPQLYSLAAVTGGCLVSTSIAEAAPMTFLEAMACGCPIVSTAVDGASDLLGQGSRGWLYETGDVAGAVAVIENLVNGASTDARKGIIADALRYVHSEHTAEHAARFYARQLESIVTRASGESSEGKRAAPAPRRARSGGFRVLAVITSLNDEDIISRAIERLVEDGIDVHLLDLGSSDGTLDEARGWLNRGLIAAETHPLGEGEGDPAVLARRRAEVCREVKAHWYLCQRSDEASFGPWPRLSLRAAIRHADQLGFERIRSRAITLRPVDRSFAKGQDPVTHFRFWEDDPDAETDFECWKQGVEGTGRRLPLRFLTCRFPIRGQEQSDVWDRTQLRRFNINRLRLESALNNDRTLAAEARHDDLATFVRQFRRAMDAESDLISRALRTVGQDRGPRRP